MKYKVVLFVLLLIAIAGCVPLETRRQGRLTATTGGLSLTGCESQTCPERSQGMTNQDRLSSIPKKVLYVKQIPDDMKQTSIGSIYIGAFDKFSGEIYILKRNPLEKFLTFQYSDDDILLHETGHWIEWYLSTNCWNQWLQFEFACEKLTGKDFDSEWFADTYRKICKRLVRRPVHRSLGEGGGPQGKAEKLVYDLLWSHPVRDKASGTPDGHRWWPVSNGTQIKIASK